MIDVTSALAVLTFVDFSIQWILFIVSAVWKTEKFYDLAGSFSFIALAYLSFQWGSEHTWRQKIQTSFVFIWAVRLGLFLFIRILKTGKDRRFDKARHRPALMFILWTLQGIWVLVTLLPTLLLILNSRDYPLTFRDYIGWSLWSVGFLLEAVADYQKAVFRNNPSFKGQFISTGLWSISRHPNYFGEILLWFGLYLSASTVFRGNEMLCVLCPIFDMLLITRISGIPLLEKYGLQKWGLDPDYQNYLKNTAVLIPYVW